MEPLVFIILRHLGQSEHNVYWNIAYKCVRRWYPEVPIVIIDDHSMHRPTLLPGLELYKTTVINSSLPPNRGELLPYYYFYIRRFAKNAVFLHDTVFLNKRISPEYLYTKTYNYIWEIDDSARANEIMQWKPQKILSRMEGAQGLHQVYQDRSKWSVCFGGMVFIELNFLSRMFDGNNHLKVLVEEVSDRKGREAFERVIGVLLSRRGKTSCYLGNVSVDQLWLQTLQEATSHMRAYPSEQEMYKIWLARSGTSAQGSSYKNRKSIFSNMSVWSERPRTFNT